MKAKVLFWTHDDYSGNGVERVYLNKNFKQAENDLAMLKEHSDKIWELIDVDVYEGDEPKVMDFSDIAEK